MARRQHPNGDRYLRTYRSIEHPVTLEEFSVICAKQGITPPSPRMFTHITRLYRNGQANYLPINAHDQALRVRRDKWDAERVRDLVRSRAPETMRLELKQEVGADAKVKRGFAAMANAGGGDVVFGIGERNSTAARLIPLQLSGLQERILQYNQTIDPPVNMEVIPVKLRTNGRGALVVRIAGAVPGTVHLIDGRAPIRENVTTRNMRAEELRRWIQEGKRPNAS